MNVALFITCLNDVFFPRVGVATTTLLERLGHEVAFPAAQTCCGQMHANTGYAAPARTLERNVADVFKGHDVVVSPSGSCVVHVRAHTEIPVYELSELLVDVLG